MGEYNHEKEIYCGNCGAKQSFGARLILPGKDEADPVPCGRGFG